MFWHRKKKSIDQPANNTSFINNKNETKYRSHEEEVQYLASIFGKTNETTTKMETLSVIILSFCDPATDVFYNYLNLSTKYLVLDSIAYLIHWAGWAFDRLRCGHTKKSAIWYCAKLYAAMYNEDEQKVKELMANRCDYLQHRYHFYWHKGGNELAQDKMVTELIHLLMWELQQDDYMMIEDPQERLPLALVGIDIEMELTEITNKWALQVDGLFEIMLMLWPR